jgi:hypothetical protein
MPPHPRHIRYLPSGRWTAQMHARGASPNSHAAATRTQQDSKPHLTTQHTAHRPAWEHRMHTMQNPRPCSTHHRAVARTANCLAHARVPLLPLPLLLPPPPAQVDASNKAPQLRRTVRRCCFTYPDTHPYTLPVSHTGCWCRHQTWPALCAQDGHMHVATCATHHHTHAESSPAQAIHCTSAARDGLIDSCEPTEGATSFTPGDDRKHTPQLSI